VGGGAAEMPRPGEERKRKRAKRRAQIGRVGSI